MLQTVVTVDDSAVKFVQVGGRETAAVQLYHRTDVRRKNGNGIEDHPLGTVARLAERLDHFQSLDDLDFFLTGRLGKLFFQLCRQFFDVDLGKKFSDRLGTHSRPEIVFVFFSRALVLGIGEKLFLFQRRIAGIDDDVAGKVKHALKKTRGHIEEQTHSRRNGAEIPDVRYRSGKLDVAHALAAHLLRRDLDAALLADLAFEADSLVLAAKTFPILRRAKDTLAEQTVTLGFQRAVVDGLGFRDFAVRPGTDHFGRRQTDFDRIKSILIHIHKYPVPPGCPGGAALPFL